jgi:hypothetical protein
MAGGQDRAFEEVVEEFRKRPESMSGPERQYFSFSFYYHDVKAYIETFPRLSVYLYKDLKAEAAGLVEDLYGFLGVDESFAPKMEVKHSSGTPRSRLLDRLLRTKGFISSKLPLLKLIPLDARVRLTDRLLKINLEKRDRMKEETRRYLKKLYREDVLRLQDLIDRDLTVWL